MNATTRDTLDRLLARSPAQWAFHRRAGERLVVLAYHAIDDPARFADQLDHLAVTATPVPLDAVVDSVHGRRALPDRAVLITFDDGARSVHDEALPLLRERKPPVVFATFR